MRKEDGAVTGSALCQGICLLLLLIPQSETTTVKDCRDVPICTGI